MDFPYDAHTHTNVSDGRNSVEENVRAAEAVGLELVVISDHYWPENNDMEDRVQAIVTADEQSCVKVIPGAECMIMDSSGTIALDDYEGRLVRFVHVEFGGRPRGIGLDPPANVDRLLANIFGALTAVAQNPLVDSIAHPFNLGRFATPLSPGQLPRSGLHEVAAVLFENDVAFEIMNQMPFWYPDMPVAQFTAEYADIIGLFGSANVKFVLGSDAHSAGAVGNVRWCQRVMRMAGIEKSQVLDLPRKFAD